MRFKAVSVLTNNIAWGAIGPQIMIPDGPFRPYTNAAIAYTDFSTTSTLTDPFGQFQSIELVIPRGTGH